MLSQGTISLKAKGEVIPVVVGTDYAAWSSVPRPKIDLASMELVFVGYGAVAAEYQWDDYASANVHGKTVIMLSGDPPVADFADPSKLDQKMFMGRALSVYGHTGTKLETSYKHGAIAVILISGERAPALVCFRTIPAKT